MKAITSCLFIALFSLSAVSVQSTTIVKSKSNISNNLIVQCVSCKPPVTTTQPATADQRGYVTVDVAKAGTYKISAADGPKKGQVLETITATKAGRVSLKVKLAATE